MVLGFRICLFPLIDGNFPLLFFPTYHCFLRCFGGISCSLADYLSSIKWVQTETNEKLWHRQCSFFASSEAASCAFALDCPPLTFVTFLSPWHMID